ncbi:MAG: hypothetical protein WEG56_11165, partial [Chloroflexota bacterium]
MIIVVGPVAALDEPGDDALTPAGLTAAIAHAASAAGAGVEVVTRIGDDAAGDSVLLAFAAGGIGHVATLRDPAHPTVIVLAQADGADPDTGADTASDEPVAPGGLAPSLDAADVGLALRYLADERVIVLVHAADPGVTAEAVAAAGYAGAHLVLVTAPGEPPPGDLPPGALVVEATDDADGVAALVGRYAAAVDGGQDPDAAF